MDADGGVSEDDDEMFTDNDIIDQAELDKRDGEMSEGRDPRIAAVVAAENAKRQQKEKAFGDPKQRRAKSGPKPSKKPKA